LVAREARELLESRELRRGEETSRGDLFDADGGGRDEDSVTCAVVSSGERKASRESLLPSEGGLFGSPNAAAPTCCPVEGVAGAKTQTVPSSQPTATREESADLVVQSSTFPELLLRLAVRVLTVAVTMAVTFPLVSFIQGGRPDSYCSFRPSPPSAAAEMSPAP
jgi:hypothetical protein